MIRYSVDSTMTLRETPVFKTGRKGTGVYDRKNSGKDGFSLSNPSKRKIKQYISGYFLENDHIGKNISWVTLTVPPRIDGFAYQEWCDDSRIIKQLSKYLENLRKNHGLKNYVWVAERQDGKRNDYQHCTGAIHFHCVFDFEGFVSYPNLNLYWLKLLNELGYKAFSDQHFKKIESDFFSIEKTYERYRDSTFAKITEGLLSLPEYRAKIQRVCDEEKLQCLEILERQSFRDALQGVDPMTLNPEHPFCKIAFNPVDIERIKIKDFTKLQTYLTKYVTKNETKIHGRVWGASRGFSAVSYEINITAAEAARIKEIEKIILAEKESKFEIGNNEYTAITYKLDYSKFKNNPVFEKLMDHITNQRLSGKPAIPDSVPVDQHFKYVSEAFSELKSRTYFINDETRMETIVFPVSTMPINHDFDRNGVDLYMPKSKKKLPKPPKMPSLELFDFVEKSIKSYK